MLIAQYPWKAGLKPVAQKRLACINLFLISARMACRYIVAACAFP